MGVVSLTFLDTISQKMSCFSEERRDKFSQEGLKGEKRKEGNDAVILKF